MENEQLRLLLISSDRAGVSLLNDCLDRIPTHSYGLDWVSTPDAAAAAINSALYEGYFLDTSFAGNEDGELLRAILALEEVVPAIALTDSPEAGLAALEAGATDYLIKSQLSKSELARSLRLSMAWADSQRQLRQYHLAEEAIQENEWAFQVCDERLHGVLESLEDVLWSFDPRINKLLYLSSAVEEMYGRTMSEFFEDFSLWRALVYPEDRERVERCDRLLAETGSFDLDYRIVRADGSLRWVRERTYLLEDDKGTAIRKNSIVTDITQRRKVVEEVRCSEERFRIVVEQTGQLIYDYHIPSGNIAWAGAIEKMTGYAPEDFQTIDIDAWEALIHPSDRALAVERLDRAMELKTQYCVEYRFQQQDGSYIYVEDNGVFLGDDRAEVTRMLGTMTDISDRKQTEAELRQREQEFRALVENAPDIIMRVDRDGRYLYVNPKIEQAVGIPPADFIGKTSEELGFPQALVSLWHKTVERVFETAEEQTLEYEVPLPEGAIRYSDSRLVPEFNEEGAVESVLVVARDISVLKQAEAALRSSEGRYRELADSISDVFFAMDGRWCYTYWNQASEKLTGIPAQNALGQSLYDLFPEVRGTEVEQLYQTVLRTQSPQSCVQEFSLQERRFFFDITAYPSNGGLSVFVKDITERKRAEEKLQYRLRLETALSEISRALATNPKVYIQGIFQILGEAVGASCIYFIKFREEGTQGCLEHIWCSDRALPSGGHCQCFDLSQFPWWMRALQENQNIFIPDVEALPPAAQTEKHYLKSINVWAVLAVPIYTQSGQLWGQIGLDSDRKNGTTWSEEDAQLLRVVGEMLYSYCDRTQTQEELRASEALYSSIFNHAAESIFLVNVSQKGQFIYETLNPSHEKKTGIRAADIAGKTPRQVLTPEVVAWVEARYRECLRVGETISYEETLPLPGGTLTWRTNLVPIRDRAGRIVKLLGSCRDITEEKRLEQERQQQLDRERLLARIAQDIRSSLDLDEILNTTVREVCQLLGSDRALIFRLTPDKVGFVSHEAVGVGITPTLGLEFEEEEFPPECYRDYCLGKARIIPDISVDETASCLLDYLQELGVRSRLVVPILQQESLWGLLIVHQCRRVRSWQGWEVKLLEQLATQVAIAIQQAQLLEEQTRYTQELARSNRELEQFAYIASHDLQEPLRGVISFAQLLEAEYRDRLDAEAREYIDFIVNDATRMRQLIQDLLAFSRVGTRGQEFALTDCEQVLEQVLGNLRLALRESQAVVTHDPLPTVIADESQLLQLLQNLIANGIKFCSHAPPRIHISALKWEKSDNFPYPRTEEWLFSVRDNGIGIDSQYRDRIFVIFQRLHPRKQYQGTGIGLAICQKIVQRHGGRIWVESEVGQGATFYFTLPERTSRSY